MPLASGRSWPLPGTERRHARGRSPTGTAARPPSQVGLSPHPRRRSSRRGRAPLHSLRLGFVQASKRQGGSSESGQGVGSSPGSTMAWRASSRRSAGGGIDLGGLLVTGRDHCRPPEVIAHLAAACRCPRLRRLQAPRRLVVGRCYGSRSAPRRLVVGRCYGSRSCESLADKTQRLRRCLPRP